MSGAAGTKAVARELVVQSSVYDLDVVKKAAYRFLERAVVDFEVRGTEIVCRFSFLHGVGEAAADIALQDFKAELLDQDLRRTIANETAPIRNTILALAFAPIKPTERE